MIFFAAPISERALLLKNPVDRISFASSSCEALAIASIVEYFLKRPGVTLLTRSSVHCADKIVATSNCHGFLWMRAQVAFGKIASSCARMRSTRSFRSAAVLGFGTFLGGVTG